MLMPARGPGDGTGGRRPGPAGGRRSGSPGSLGVAVLCSARAPGLATLLERGGEPDAPYRVVACVSSDPDCREAGLLAAGGVPLRTLDIHGFYRERGTPLTDLALRAAYDRSVLAAVEESGADAVLLCGYLYVVTPTLLDAFPDRVLNVHHSDLTVTGPDGRPRYRGLRAVRDAIAAGEPETRSTVHLATERVDDGPLLVRSGAFPVPPLVDDARARGREDVVRAYAYAHREWMMEASWGPLLDRSLELLARGGIRRNGRGVLVDGRPGPLTLETGGGAELPAATVHPGHGSRSGLAPTREGA